MESPALAAAGAANEPGCRAATEADVPALTALINAAFVAESAFIDGPRIDPDGVRALMGKECFLVADLPAEAEKRHAGCLFLELRGDHGYFGLLSVEPALQGAGLGKKLVAWAEHRARAAGCERMEIRVVDQRRELPPYYRRLGYVEVGTEPFPADQPTHVPCCFIKMSKRL